MIVALDVGNTRIKAALFAHGAIIARDAVLTSECTSSRSIERLIASVCGRSPERSALPGIAIASVVPAVEQHIEQALMAMQRHVALPGIFVSPDRDLGIEVGVTNPASLGPDRIADAVAAADAYGCPVIVINCGSAVTLTVVDGSRRLIGGAIAPGPVLAARSLGAFTGRLPMVEVTDELTLPPVLGRDTEPAIRAGVLHALAGTVAQFAREARSMLGQATPTVLTGGFAEPAAAALEEPRTIVPDLTLLGIRCIALRHGARD